MGNFDEVWRRIFGDTKAIPSSKFVVASSATGSNRRRLLPTAPTTASTDRNSKRHGVGCRCPVRASCKTCGGRRICSQS